MQQSLARLLGVLDYNAYPHALPEAVDCLLESVDKNSRQRMANVEARRNCMTSIPLVIASVSSTLPSRTSSGIAFVVCTHESGQISLLSNLPRYLMH